tara:strand:+ start:361 stop:1992 length:1632 start_codon:yes stop_codon:yes gene_type:complete
MASTYSNLGLELQATGENANTWGDKTNTNLTMIDERLSEISTITSTSASQSISAPSDGTSGETTRYATIKYTGSASGAITVTLPASVKIIYNIINSTGQTITFQNSTTTTTASIVDGESSIIHSDGSANVYKIGGTPDFQSDVTVKTSDGGLLTLQTSDTTVADGDTIGALQFSAPSEASGTDAITTAAAIVAEADATFAADANNTDLVFKVGSSGAASEKMRLAHEGHLTVSGSATAGGRLITDDTTEATSTTDGSLQTDGGLSVAKDTVLGDDLKLLSDSAVVSFGADSDTTLTHTDGSGLTLNSTNKIMFNDASQFIQGSSATVLALGATDEIDLTATTIDINGAVAMDGAITGGTNITISGELDAATLDISGNADIDGTLEADAITVNGTALADVVVSSVNTDIQIDSLGVGTAASGTTGEIRATNNVTAFYSSDKKFKENITNIPDAVSKVQALNGVNYDWTDEYIFKNGGEDGYFLRKNDIGVIAQEVEAVLPEVVRDRPDGSKAVAYEKLVPLLIEAIKELKDELDVVKSNCCCGG